MSIITRLSFARCTRRYDRHLLNKSWRMPIFHDPEEVAPPPTVLQPLSTEIEMRRLSEDSIHTEFQDGPLSDNATEPSPTNEDLPVLTGAGVTDRAELIERIKRGESPTWVPSKSVRHSLPITPWKLSGILFGILCIGRHEEGRLAYRLSNDVLLCGSSSVTFVFIANNYLLARGLFSKSQ